MILVKGGIQMENKNILISVFKTYGINKVYLNKKSNTYNFIISAMEKSISLDRWNYLETVLKDITNKNVTLLPYEQALQHFGDNYINESLVIL